MGNGRCKSYLAVKAESGKPLKFTVEISSDFCSSFGFCASVSRQCIFTYVVEAGLNPLLVTKSTS